ncbi:MAG: SDR family NAD(P)-dependent oxidoreductase, partial [Planctomycetota bacterium]|nr:SDR family NAD(P)-dependent oxidoreductase [Planctomycetota bacterium]
MKSLAGRTALVTGAGTGIGAASALALGGCGARLVLVGRTAERLAPVADGLEQSGIEAHVLAADVRSPELLERLDGLGEP